MQCMYCCAVVPGSVSASKNFKSKFGVVHEIRPSDGVSVFRLAQPVRSGRMYLKGGPCHQGFSLCRTPPPDSGPNYVKIERRHFRSTTRTRFEYGACTNSKASRVRTFQYVVRLIRVLVPYSGHHIIRTWYSMGRPCISMIPCSTCTKKRGGTRYPTRETSGTQEYSSTAEFFHLSEGESLIDTGSKR